MCGANRNVPSKKCAACARFVPSLTCPTKTVMDSGGCLPQATKGHEEMNDAEQTDSNLRPAMWNQSASGVGSRMQLGKIRDNLIGSWQPGPNWAFSVPTASKAPAEPAVWTCSSLFLWLSDLGLPAGKPRCRRRIHPPMHSLVHATSPEQILR